MEKKISSVVESLKKHALENGSKIAVLDPKNSLTYSQLWEKVQAFATYLQYNCNVKKGDIVVARTWQDVWYVVVYLGIHMSGATTLGLEKNVSDDTVRSLCALTASKVLVSNKPGTPEFSVAGMSYVDSTCIKDIVSESGRSAVTLPEGTTVADIMYTTGTTGASKGVCITHQSLVNNASKLIGGFGFRDDTVIIVPGPLNHGGALRKLHATLVNGSTMYILNGMLALKEFYAALDCGLGRMACCLPPSAVRMLLTLSGKKIAAFAGAIDFIESASAPLPEVDRLMLGNYLPDTRIIIQYGSTECGGLTVYDCNHERGLIGCVGRAMQGCEVVIVDDNGHVIQSDKDHPGTVASRGDAQMECYYNEPELTAEVLRDGYVYTNDMGYFDESGRLFIIGRQDDVINVGGLKVSPFEVEEAALKYAGISDCICVSVRDTLLGSIPVLYVVPSTVVEPDAEGILKYLSTCLEAYKVPRSVKLVGEVRRLFNGKIDRKSYREQ